MATQGLLSITDKGQVTAKIITGSNGQCIPDLKLWLLENRNAGNKEIFEIAKELFGVSSLILQSSPTNSMADESIFDDANEVISKPESLYQSKFNDPIFNPRWDFGIADYTEVLEIGMPQNNERYEQRYNVWGGNASGKAPDYSRCCEVVSHGTGLSKQCSRKRGFGPEEAYCKQHAKQFN